LLENFEKVEKWDWHTFYLAVHLSKSERRKVWAWHW